MCHAAMEYRIHTSKYKWLARAQCMLTRCDCIEKDVSVESWVLSLHHHLFKNCRLLLLQSLTTLSTLFPPSK